VKLEIKDEFFNSFIETLLEIKRWAILITMDDLNAKVGNENIGTERQTSSRRKKWKWRKANKILLKFLINYWWHTIFTWKVP
jgi:hypothetical protein